MANIDKKVIENLKSDSETKGKRIDDLATGLKRTEAYMIGIAIVTALGFGTLMLTTYALFIDSLNTKSSSYQSLVDQVRKLNQNIENQKKEADTEELKYLRNQIEQIKIKNPYLK